MNVVSGSAAPCTNSTSNTGYMYGCCKVRKRSRIVRRVSGVHSSTLLGFFGTNVNSRSVLTDPSRTTNQCLSTLNMRHGYRPTITAANESEWRWWADLSADTARKRIKGGGGEGPIGVRHGEFTHINTTSIVYASIHLLLVSAIKDKMKMHSFSAAEQYEPYTYGKNINLRLGLCLEI